MQIDGSTVLVTGGSSGIGAELAVQLCEAGATVGIVGRRAERLAAVLERCRAHTPRSRMWVADLGDLDAAADLAIEAWDAFGGLDALVNNAAIPMRRVVTELTWSETEATNRIDYLSPVRMFQALLGRWLERDAGLCVFVSSTGGRIPIIHEAAYNGAKYGLCGYAEAAAVDLAGTGVDVKLVLPGPIDTDIWDRPGSDGALFDLELVPAADCAAGIVEAMTDDGFEYIVPPVFPGGIDAKQMILDKTADCDAYVSMMGQVAQGLAGH